MAEQWRILVVEDEENLNWNIVNSLQKDGYIVQGVTSGAETIRLLWSEEYDVVICSQKMPDADGFELLQWIRTYCPNTLMVMLASSDSAAARTQALEVGVVSYLEKPLDLHVLKEELRRLLHQTGFSASLDSFDLLDVIQIITLSRKSIALVVSTGLEEQGILRFQNGELIWAEYGTLRGEEAFFALAAHKNGTVVHRPWNDQITPNVTQPLSRLIFQALQYRSKYADFQQLSGEQEVVKPPTAALASPVALSSLLQDTEEDEDRPFVFVTETETRSDAMATGISLEPMTGGSSTQTALEYLIGASVIGTNPAQAVDDLLYPVGTFEQATAMVGLSEGTKETGDAGLGANGPAQMPEKQWWEQTGAYPKLGRENLAEQKGPGASSGALINPAVTRPLRPLAGKDTAANGAGITPSIVKKAAATRRPDLPSWLIDQPTQFNLPVLREGTGQVPAVPEGKAQGTGTLQPDQAQPSSAEWQPLPDTAQPPPAKPSDTLLRKPRPEQAIYGQVTGAHRPITATPPGKAGATIPARKTTPAEWQEPGTTLAAQAGTGASQTGTLQSLASLKKAGAIRPVEAQKDQEPPAHPLPAERAQAKTPKRNYGALAAALQTLGYSVPGFVASAIVSLDGQPIAQVAVDDLDISPLCGYFSGFLRAALLSLEQGNWGEHEDTVITSSAQHILLRLINGEQGVFQVLITTRETRPGESLEAMANVEAAIASALH